MLHRQESFITGLTSFQCRTIVLFYFSRNNQMETLKGFSSDTHSFGKTQKRFRDYSPEAPNSSTLKTLYILCQFYWNEQMLGIESEFIFLV